MSFDDILKQGICMNTNCNNKLEYRLLMVPNLRENPNPLIRETYYCKECLIQWISGNNIQLYEDVIIRRVVV